MEPETVTHGFTLIIGAAVGVFGTLLVVFGRSEAAKHRLMERTFWPTLERVRAQTGGRVGVVEPLPIELDEPYWLRVPQDLPDCVAQDPADDDPGPWDDEDDYPRDEARVAAGAWRRETVRGDGQPAEWPVNSDTGKHHLAGDDTQDLRVYAAAFHGFGVIAP